MSENIEYCWDEFRDWCEDNCVSLEHQDDWGPWWDCWKAAIDAKKAQDAIERDEG